MQIFGNFINKKMTILIVPLHSAFIYAYMITYLGLDFKEKYVIMNKNGGF